MTNATDADGWQSIIRRLRQGTAGEFEILREVGRGGMAAVFLAREFALDRHVAMKLMSPALLTGAGMVERFQREARTVARLTHPNIVTIHAVRQIDHLHYFTMQFVEGQSLDRIVREAGPLPVPTVRAILYRHLWYAGRAGRGPSVQRGDHRLLHFGGRLGGEASSRRSPSERRGMKPPCGVLVFRHFTSPIGSTRAG